MSVRKASLALRPELCDRCGRCVRSCPEGKLRVSSGFIYVDISACTGCLSCVSACKTGAIQSASKGDRYARPVVRTRAEAKAMRAAATAASVKASVAPSASAKAEKVSRDWVIEDAVLLGGILALAMFGKASVLRSDWLLALPAGSRMVIRAGVLGVFYSVQLAALWFLARRRGVDALDAFGLRFVPIQFKSLARSAGIVLLALVFTRIAATAWGASAQALGWDPPRSESLTTIFGQGGTGLALAVLMVVVVGPVVEEVVFRGVMLRSLSQRFGEAAGIALSAAVFALYHLTPWIAVPTFILGVVLAWLVTRFDSLWMAIVVHGAYNAVVVAGAFYLAR